MEGEDSKGEIGWKAVMRVQEDEHLFLLYIALAKFIALPKRVISAEQMEELRRLLRENIV